jgi:outer membrane phospholipase A
VPIRTKLLNFETYLLIQYFNGYGESLLHYDTKSETVRAGLSLVR